METAFKQQLIESLGTKVRWNCPLANYTSFRIGGPAEALVTLENEEELLAVLRLLQDHDVTWKMIGRGTNLLVSDSGVEGVVLVLGGDFKDIRTTCGGESGYEYIEAGGAAGLTRLAHFCVEKGLAGLEFASGIPGSVGGAVIMNAGAWGSDISKVLHSVKVVDVAQQRMLERTELNFGYRCWLDHRESSSPLVVTGVVVRLRKGDRQAMKERCEQYRQQRLRAQPQKVANAGSIFKNPPNDSAGRLIEASGLKGMRIGGAMVSPVHANFIVNCGKATAAEVLELMSIVRSRVEEDSGILLEPEVNCL